jgi:DNA-binding MarR family transcriptional regulator
MTDDPIAFEVFNEIGIIDQLAGTMFASVMPVGMTQAQFTVLNHFVRLGVAEKSPADLANAFQLTRPTMTSTLSRMERAGLISVRPDPADGRAKLVSLTSEGRTMRENCISALLPLLPMISSVVSNAELSELLPALRKIRIKLDALRD